MLTPLDKYRREIPQDSPLGKHLLEGNFTDIKIAHSEFVRKLLEENRNSPKSPEEKDFFSREIERIPSSNLLHLNKIALVVEISLRQSCTEVNADAVGGFLSSLRKTEALDSLFQTAFSKVPSLKDQLNILEELIKRGLGHYLTLVDFPKYTLLERLIGNSVDESKIREYFLLHCIGHDTTLAFVEEGKAFFKEKEIFLEAIPLDAPLKEYLREMRILDKEGLLKVETSLVETAESLEVSFELLKTFLQEQDCEIGEDLSETLNTFLYTRFVSLLADTLNQNPSNLILASLQKTCDSKHDIQKKIASLKNILKGAKAGTPSHQKLKEALTLPYAQLREGLPAVDPEKEAAKALFDSLKTKDPLYCMIGEEAYLRRHIPSLNWLLEEETYEDYLNLLEELSSSGEEISDLLAKKQDLDLRPVSERILETIQYIKTMESSFSKELLLRLKYTQAPEKAEIKDEIQIALDLLAKMSFSEKVAFMSAGIKESLLKGIVAKGDHESVLAAYETFKRDFCSEAEPEKSALENRTRFFQENYLNNESVDLSELEDFWKGFNDWSLATPLSPLKDFFEENGLISDIAFTDKNSFIDKVLDVKAHVELFASFLEKEATEVGEVFHADRIVWTDLKNLSNRSKEIAYKKFMGEVGKIETKYSGNERVIAWTQKLRKFKGEDKSLHILNELRSFSLLNILDPTEVVLLQKTIQTISTYENTLDCSSLKDTSPLKIFFKELGVTKDQTLRSRKMLVLFGDSLKKALKKFKVSSDVFTQLEIALKKQDLEKISLIAEHVCCLEYQTALVEGASNDPYLKKLISSFPKKSPTLLFSRSDMDKIAKALQSSGLALDKKAYLQGVLEGELFIADFRERQEKEASWFFNGAFAKALNKEDWLLMTKTGVQKQELLDKAFQIVYLLSKENLIHFKMHPMYMRCLEAAFLTRDLRTLNWIFNERTYEAYQSQVKDQEAQGRDVSFLYRLNEELKDLSVESRLKEIVKKLKTEKLKLYSQALLFDLEKPLDPGQAVFSKKLLDCNFSIYLKNLDSGLFYNYVLTADGFDEHNSVMVFNLYEKFVNEVKIEIGKIKGNQPKALFLKVVLECLRPFDFIHLDRIAAATLDKGLTEALRLAFSLNQVERASDMLAAQPSYQEFLEAFIKSPNEENKLAMLNQLLREGMSSYIGYLMKKGDSNCKKIGYRFFKEVILEDKETDEDEKISFFLEHYMNYSEEDVSELLDVFTIGIENFDFEQDWVDEAKEDSPLRCFLEREGIICDGKLALGISKNQMAYTIDSYLAKIVLPFLKSIDGLGLYEDFFQESMETRNLEDFDFYMTNLGYENFLSSLEKESPAAKALNKIAKKADSYEEEIKLAEQCLRDNFPSELEKLKNSQRDLISSERINNQFWSNITNEKGFLSVYLARLGVNPLEFISPAENLIYAKSLIKDFVEVLGEKARLVSLFFSEELDELVDLGESHLNALCDGEEFEEISSIADKVIYLEYKQCLKDFKISYVARGKEICEKIQSAKEFVRNNRQISSEQRDRLENLLEGGEFFSKKESLIENQSSWFLRSSFKNDFLSIIGNPETDFYRKYVAVQKTFHTVALKMKKGLSDFDPIYLRILELAYLNQNTVVFNWLFAEILYKKRAP